MAEENQKSTHGVILEFDFTVIDGAQMLFDITSKMMQDRGLDFNVKLEAMHLVGGNGQGGFAELFHALNSKHDPAKAARELGEAFSQSITEAYATAITPAFRQFVGKLLEKGVKVVVATRGDVEALKPLLAEFGEGVVVYPEPSTTYGGGKWDAWRRVCAQNELIDVLTVAVAGSGHGVKSALIAGLGTLGVEHPHVSYQDFGGADYVVEKLDGGAADLILDMMHV